MGILNVTPDSFSDGGRFFSVDAAVDQAQRLVAEGADIIDVGGESTRPGAAPVSVDEELHRVIPVITALAGALTVPVSIDTYKARVMWEAHAAGASFINDVSALSADPDSLATVRDLDVPVCLMHMRGRPATMQLQAQYQDVVRDVAAYLQERAELCVRAGIDPGRIVLDPGFGFGKNTGHNLALLHRLDAIRALGFPVLVGLSRKSLIGQVLDLPVTERVEAGLALAVIAVWQGAQLIRTHDVRATARAVAMTHAVLRADPDTAGNDLRV